MDAGDRKTPIAFIMLKVIIFTSWFEDVGILHICSRWFCQNAALTYRRYTSLCTSLRDLTMLRSRYLVFYQNILLFISLNNVRWLMKLMHASLAAHLLSPNFGQGQSSCVVRGAKIQASRYQRGNIFQRA